MLRGNGTALELEFQHFPEKVLELSLVQTFKMADDSSSAGSVPIWCDVGKNLNAAYLIVNLRDFVRGKPSYDRNSKNIVKIYSRFLTLNGHVVSTSTEVDTEEDENTVFYPGKYMFLLSENSVEDANEFSRTCIINCLNRGEISYFLSIITQTSTVAFASMTSLVHEYCQSDSSLREF